MQSYGHTSNGASNLLLSHKTYATGDKEFPSFILGACLLAACLVEGVMPVAKVRLSCATSNDHGTGYLSLLAGTPFAFVDISPCA